MPVVAPLSREYRGYAIGYLLVGIAGWAASPDRGTALRSFLIMGMIMMCVLGAVNLRWLQASVRHAPPTPPGASVEEPRRTLLRIAVELLFVAVLVGLSALAHSRLAPLMAGIAFGTGVVNLAGWWWLMHADRAGGAVSMRQAPDGLVGVGRRAVTRRAPAG
ncbi:MAG: hypothetical protein U0Y82_12090 [Thermoleophilia bacterium]